MLPFTAYPSSPFEVTTMMTMMHMVTLCKIQNFLDQVRANDSKVKVESESIDSAERERELIAIKEEDESMSQTSSSCKSQKSSGSKRDKTALYKLIQKSCDDQAQINKSLQADNEEDDSNVLENHLRQMLLTGKPLGIRRRFIKKEDETHLTVKPWKCDHEVNFESGYCKKCHYQIQAKHKSKKRQPYRAIYKNLKNNLESFVMRKYEAPASGSGRLADRKTYF